MQQSSEKIEYLKELVRELDALTQEDKRFNMVAFLLDMIDMAADQKTLSLMIADIERYSRMRKQRPEIFV